MMFILYVILLGTLVVSIASLRDFRLEQRLIGHPYSTHVFKQWYRLLTSGFIHADPMHLLFNLYTLRSFGRIVLWSSYYAGWGLIMSQLLFLLLYLGGILSANLVSYHLHRNDRYYRNLGASAGVMAVMSSAILYHPQMEIGMFFLPIGIPAFLYLPVFLIWSLVASKNRSNIGHLAHFVGSIFGIAFTLCIRYREVWAFVQTLAR